MTTIDLDSLLTEVTSDSPAGEDLEYEPEFSALARAAEGRAEQSLGDASIAADPPDWKTVNLDSISLLSKSKDLRLALLLTRAQLHINGFSGFNNSLFFIKGLLEKYWDSLHPALDPLDNYDPTFRVNILITLCDRDMILNGLMEAPLVYLKGIGEFGVRDVVAAKTSSPEDASKGSNVPDMNSIYAAFMDCKIDDLKEISETLNEISECVISIDKILIEQIGNEKAPDLSPLNSVIKNASSIVNEYLLERNEPIDTVDDLTQESGVTSVNRPGNQSSNYEIRSREDAAMMMDRISDYFTRHEPSSPIPLFMQRAKRLSTLGFMEILKDMAPDGLKQAQSIGGNPSDDS
ncbi:type VI secretion system protein TssA [Neptunomonas sp.]|uniref:type VI secretion system protein TssA n=1 Tax=Neptunomonas sp. TaxID=1971898 RepID=UPI0025D828D7|nr:type VI secretion system protein TssA [Neptunomonas sp.]